jgi:hypothetical protein
MNENDEGIRIGMAFREQPIIPVYDIAGNYAGSNTANLGNARNPVAIQQRTQKTMVLITGCLVTPLPK